MSTNNQPLNTGQELITNYDVSKIFLWNNRYETALYTNSVYNPETLLAGQIMGRVSATNQIVKLFSTATDGSQFPIGILADNYTVESGEQKTLTICVAGDIAAEKVLFESNDGFNTVISSRTLLDRIGSDTVGVKLVFGTEMTAYDNQ